MLSLEPSGSGSKKYIVGGDSDASATMSSTVVLNPIDVKIVKAYIIFRAILPFAHHSDIFRFGSVSHRCQQAASNESMNRYLMSRDYPCQYNPYLNHIDDTYYASYRKLIRIFYNLKRSAVDKKQLIRLKLDMEFRNICPISSRSFFATTSHKVKTFPGTMDPGIEIDIPKGRTDKTQETVTVVYPIDGGNQVLINSPSLGKLFLCDIIAGSTVYEFPDFHFSERIDEIDPTTFAATSPAGRIRFWNRITGKMIHEYFLGGEAFFQKIEKERDRVIFLRERRDSTDCTTKLFRIIESLESIFSQFRTLHNKPVHTLMISDEMVFSASEDAMTISRILYNPKTDKFGLGCFSFVPPPTGVAVSHITPNDRLCIGHDDGTIDIWNCNQNVLFGKDSEPRCITIRPFSKILDTRIKAISHTFDHIMLVTNSTTATCINVLNGEILGRTVTSVFTPAGYNGKFFSSIYNSHLRQEVTQLDYSLMEEDQLLHIAAYSFKGKDCGNILNPISSSKPAIAHSLLTIWPLTASEFLTIDRDLLLSIYPSPDFYSLLPKRNVIGHAIYHAYITRLVKDLKSNLPRLILTIPKRWEKLPVRMRKGIFPREGNLPDLNSELNRKNCIECIESLLKERQMRFLEGEKKEASFPVARSTISTKVSSIKPLPGRNFFHLFPPAVWGCIVAFLSKRNVLQCAYISKKLRVLTSNTEAMHVLFQRHFGLCSIPLESDNKAGFFPELSWREKFLRANHYFYHLRSFPLKCRAVDVKFKAIKFDSAGMFAVIQADNGPITRLLVYNLEDKRVMQDFRLEDEIRNFQPILIDGEFHLLYVEGDSSKIIIMKSDKTIRGSLTHLRPVAHHVLGVDDTLVTQDVDNTIRVWNLKTCTLSKKEIIYPMRARNHCFKLDRLANKLFIGTSTGEIHRINLDNGFAESFKVGDEPIKTIKILNNDLLLVESMDILIPTSIVIPPSSGDKTWKYYQLLSESPLPPLENLQKPSSITVTNQNHVIISYEYCIRVWKINYDPKLRCLIDANKLPISEKELLQSNNLYIQQSSNRSHSFLLGEAETDRVDLKIITYNGNYVLFCNNFGYKIWNYETGEEFSPHFPIPQPTQKCIRIDPKFRAIFMNTESQIDIGSIDLKNHDNLLLSLAYHFDRPKFYNLPTSTRKAILDIKRLITPTTPEFIGSYLLEITHLRSEIPKVNYPYIKLAIFKHTLDSIAEAILRAPPELSDETRNRFLYLEQDYYKILFPRILEGPIPTDPKILYQEGRKAFYMLSPEACAALIRGFVEEVAKTLLTDPKNSLLYEGESFY